MCYEHCELELPNGSRVAAIRFDLPLQQLERETMLKDIGCGDSLLDSLLDCTAGKYFIYHAPHSWVVNKVRRFDTFHKCRFPTDTHCRGIDTAPSVYARTAARCDKTAGPC